MLGIALRLMVFALQLNRLDRPVGSFARTLGAGVAPRSMPAFGRVLMLWRASLAVAMGSMSGGVGGRQLPDPADGAAGAGRGTWPPGAARWLIPSPLGFSFRGAVRDRGRFATISRSERSAGAMPRLMVAFIGAPAITAGGSCC